MWQEGDVTVVTQGHVLSAGMVGDWLPKDVAALKESIVALEDEIGHLQAIDEQLRLQEEHAAARGREHCSCFWQPKPLGGC